MDITVVVPLYNEEESLPELINWIEKVMKNHGFSFEIILVDDGSNDKSWQVIEKFHQEKEFIKAIKFRRNYGKSAALQKGFEIAKGDVVITMDADLQDSPDEIPELYRMIKEENFDLVSGWKQKRYDPTLGKRIPSKLYNWTARKVTGIYLHDFNCGLKSYKNAVIKSIEIYGEMHRYIPVLAKEAGFFKIGEKVVQHQSRKYGVTKFGLERFINGFLDLLSISFITRFSKKPMHFFGSMGALMFFIGFLTSLFLGIYKIIYVFQDIKMPLLTDTPYFYLALTTMILGTQLFLTGFIAELISRNSNDRNNYQIEKIIE